MAYNNFEHSMVTYKTSYFKKVGHDEWIPRERWNSSYMYDHIIQSIVKELYSYLRDVKSFEESYGRDADHYYRMKNEKESALHRFEKKDKFDPKKIAKEWDKENDKWGYTALLNIPNFIRKVEKIISSIKEANNGKLVISDALDVLSSNKTGIASIDRYNSRLAELFNASIEKEKAEFTKETAKKVEKDIAELKESHFYKWKVRHGEIGWGASHPAKPLATPENQPIYKDSGITFKYIFNTLRSLATSLTMAEPKHYKSNDDEILRTTFNKKIASFAKDIERVSKYNSIIESDTHNYGEHLTHEETEEIRNITTQLGIKVLSLIDYYEDIIAKQKKYKRLLAYIEAMKEREKAINEELTALRSNQIDVFPKTIDMLQGELLKCTEFLKKNEDTIRLFKDLYSKFERETRAIESLMSRFNGIILECKKRKDQKEKNQLKEDEKARNLARAHEIERIQVEIDKIKNEVIHGMEIEGYRPLLFDKGDSEHFIDYYTSEYNNEFYRRLKLELDKRGINYEGADLSNPRDTAFYQRMLDQEGQKISPETITNQEPILKNVGNHSYVMTSEYYQYVFNLIKEQLDKSGKKYAYDDIVELVKEYIDRNYGLDNIRNQDEFLDIEIKHGRESGKGSSR